MNIVDSSGWLEFFAGGPNADHFSSPLSDSSTLVVPSISIYEVFKVVLRESEENEALQAVAAMQKGKIVDLDTSIAINASKLNAVSLSIKVLKMLAELCFSDKLSDKIIYNFWQK